MMMTLIIPGRGVDFAVTGFADASAMYTLQCDQSGEGASTFPDGTIEQGGETIAHVSYNGKVWARPSREWVPGTQPLHDPYA